jgi:hypothetical protein
LRWAVTRRRFSRCNIEMYSMPGSWADRQIQRMIGADVKHPLATTHTHVAWESPQLRLECNLVRNLETAQDGFAVRITPAVDPFYAAVVVPVGVDGRLYLVGRYRYAIARWSVEFPRFDLDSSEAGWKDAAEEDLRHTTGLGSASMNLLGAIQIDPALISTNTVVILAQGCTRRRSRSKATVVGAVESETPTEGDELIAGALAVSLAELSDLVERGEIVCGVTLAALAVYRARLR